MFAVIDIGTNSLLLLIADVQDDGQIRAVEDRAVVTRLGEGLARSGAISDAAAERTLGALGECWELCIERGVERVAAIGTAALRSAANAGDFLLIAKRSLGLDIEVISAEREARLTYSAAAHDFGGGIVVVDIGGGSTEFVAGGDDGVLKFRSLPLGSVSLTEGFLKGDPPSEAEIQSLRAHIHSSLDAGLDRATYACPSDLKLVATAGTATTLAAMHLRLTPYDPARAHGTLLAMEDLKGLIESLESRTIEERKVLPGLLPTRADVILAGAILLEEAMAWLGFSEATISDRGVKWGVLYEMMGSGKG